MASTPVKIWRCEVCGYLHEGPEPPAECPVCGAPAADFTPYEQPATPVLTTTVAAGATDRIVILGGGIAGVSAAEAARQAAPAAEITLVSGEPDPPYWRLNLTRLLAGEITEDAIPLHPASWYAEQRIHLLSGVNATAVDPVNHEVHLPNGETILFGKLVIAAGANAFLPPWPGSNLGHVLTVRTLADARAILQQVRPGLRCLCIGGGILGLETAGALAKHGAAVTLLEGSEWLMPRQLPRTGGEILARHVATRGIHLRPISRVREILGDDKAATGVLLEDGVTLPADLLLVTTGIRPNLTLATAAGLHTQHGIVVDDLLTTSHPDILAAGDVAEHRGVLYGLWPTAQFQGTLAGLNAAGQRSAFGGIPRSNVLKVLDLHVFSIGQFEPPDAAARVLDQETDGTYLRFVFQEGRLCGAILIGRIGLDAMLKTAIEHGRDFSTILVQRPTASDFADYLAAQAG